MSGLLKHRFVFKTFHFVLEHYFKLKFNFVFEKIQPNHDSYIVLSNHTTNFDPLMVGMSFPNLLYYVASDHIFRWGFVSSLIKFLVDPIPRLKAKTEIQTIKEILKRLKNGSNVCIFAEGNRSFTGETGDIPESTGKLIKLSGVALITYRLEGGYFTNPRWGKSLRRGSMAGRKVREYSPEQIRRMTAEELNEIIKNDLYVNAYEEQDVNPVSYGGENLAENLEVALYLCPKCGSIATLKSEGDKFGCSCGLALKYTSYGKLIAENDYSLPYNTVLNWSRWQSSKIAELAEQCKKMPSDRPIVTDKDQSLWQVEKASKSKLVCRGTLSLYNNRLVMQSDDGARYSFDFDKIADMAIYSRMILIFSTHDQISYEIKSASPRSAVKYLDLYRALK